MQDTYQAEVHKETRVLASFGQVRQEHCHTDEKDIAIFAHFPQSLQ